MNKTGITKTFSLLAALVAIVGVVLMQGGVSVSLAQTEAPTMAATGQPLTGTPIQIGVAVAQTSDTALFGQEQVLGAQVAEAFFNARGGVDGHPIKLVYQDAAGTPDTAVNAFNALINSNVVAIIGPTLTAQARAADPVASKAGFPILAPSNTAAGIGALGTFVTRVSAPVLAYAPYAIDAALALNPKAKTAVVMYAQDDAFSVSETQTFQNAAKARGLNVATVLTFSTKDRQFDAVIGPALDANPDLIIISGLAADSGNLVKQLRETGYTGLIVGGNGLNSANMFAVCQDKCDGVLVGQAYRPEFQSQINSDFLAAYHAANEGTNPSQFAGQMFTSVQVAVEALQAVDKAGKLDLTNIPQLHKDLNDAIQSGTYDTPVGKISFARAKDAQGNPQGVDVIQTVFFVAQIKMNADGKTGKFAFVKSIDTTQAATPAATSAAS